MKKLVLFIGLTVLSFGAFAEKVPSVIVNKEHGGLSALLNLYNYVHYTPAELTSTGVAQLDCSGSGFSSCRVPNCATITVNDGGTVVNISEAAKLNAFTLAINDVLAQYEAALEQHANPNAYKQNGGKGAPVPSVYTKTLALPNTGAKKTDTYVVRGVVTSNTVNSSTMKIYVEKVDLLTPTGSN